MTRAKKRSVARARRTSRARAAASRGFTLTELLVVVAMIGILATLGLVGYRRFIHTAQSSEAKAVIQGIRGGQEQYKVDWMTYLDVSSGNLDAYYPNATPNDARMNWIQPNDSRFNNPTNGWALLNVSVDGTVRFGYASVAGVGGKPTASTKLSAAPTAPTLPAGVPWYAIQAINDHDKNNVYAVFYCASTSNEIISENEQE
jgi:type IV pilus assembly protein PilA